MSAPLGTPDPPCPDCGRLVPLLERFPQGRCLDCYTPHGERLARTMTADDLTVMWGGRRPRRR